MQSEKNNPKKKNFKRQERRRKTGLPPGTLIYTGEKRHDNVHISSMVFNENAFTENIYSAQDAFLRPLPADSITWLNVDGLHDAEVVEKIGAFFKLHNLIQEDILNVYQLPKVDEYQESDLIYITLNEFYFDPEKKLKRDQISFVLGENFLISFQEEEGDYFEVIRERIRNAKGRVRKKSADYLTYTLIDSVVDSYYLVLDHYSTELENIENEIFEQKNKNHLTKIHHINKDLIYLRRSIAPLKEVVFKLMKEDIILIKNDSKIFLRDLQDHINQIVNQIDVDREYLSDLIQTNMANMNSHLNEIIKVLTLISTIFIPLTFIVGVYGMNFENLPELGWQYGYFGIWGLMILITLIQFVIFKRKKWL